MNPNYGLEVFASTVNDFDDRLPKGRSRCFDIGQWGGCGVYCAAFFDGECPEPQEIKKDDIIDAYGHEQAEKIINQYDCFEDLKDEGKA